LSEAQALEEASVLVGVIQSTIRPRLNDNIETLWKVEFREGLLK
jgi:hypothetical protein